MPKSTLIANSSCLVLEAPVAGNGYIGALSGVEEAKAADGTQVYRKIFPASRFICDPSKIELAVVRHRGVGGYTKVFGMSGYSNLDPARCAQLGIRVKQYEHAVSAMFRNVLVVQQVEFPQVEFRLVYGSSDTGVDLEIRRIAMEFSIPLLGFTCPDYLWWVDNDLEGSTICVCADKQAYAETYVRAVDVLFAANGGEVCYKMDIHAATQVFVPVVALNVLRALGANVPAFDERGKVLDAVGALEQCIKIVQIHEPLRQDDPDSFKAMADYLARCITGALRRKLPPEIAYRLGNR